MGRDDDLGRSKARERVLDRVQWVWVAYAAAGDDAALVEVGDGAVETLACRGDGEVDVGEPVAQARVQGGGNHQHLSWRVARPRRNRVRERGTRTGAVGDDEDAAIGHATHLPDRGASWARTIGPTPGWAPPARTTVAPAWGL